MDLPFTTDAFFNVFKTYNESVFPMQIVFYCIGIFIIFLLIRRHRFASVITGLALSFLWLWIAVVYHLIYFKAINPAATVFGIVFIVQAFFFAMCGAVRKLLGFDFQWNGYSITGMIFIIYALVLYPLIGSLTGHGYPYSPTLGLPCPTTIFTFGILLFSNKKVPWHLTIIPFLWSIVGTVAAVKMSVYQDYGLLVSGLIGTYLIFHSNRRFKTQSA